MIDNLKIFLLVHCLIETWLDKDILDSEIAIKGYSVIRLDRNRHGSGALLYINLLFTHSFVFKGTECFECIILSMFCSSRQHSPDFTIALLY